MHIVRPEYFDQLLDLVSDEELYRYRVRARKRAYHELAKLLTKEIKHREDALSRER